MENLSSYTYKTVYTTHANIRMTQRSISRRLVDLIIKYANIKKHVGHQREHYQITKFKLDELFFLKVISLEELEKLKGLYVIIILDFIDPIMRVTVVTTCHQTKSITKKFAHYQGRQYRRRAKHKKHYNI